MMYNPLEGIELRRENVAPGSPHPFIPLKREQEMWPRTQCLPYSEELGGKARLGTATMVLKAGYLTSCRRRDNPPKG